MQFAKAKKMVEETPDYKETLFLPRTNFPMRAGLPKKEPQWIEHWKELDIYNRLRTKTDGRENFVLHDGPPYANGHLHIGHALNKVLKDFIVRSQQMLGKNSHYVPGWDCHGLPIEWKIEEAFRSKGKNKDDISVNELRSECRKFAKEWIAIQSEEFRRLGIIGNWEKPYLTMDFSSESVIAEEFMKFLMNGSLYQGSKPVMWSPVEKTALAEAEIEYHEHESPTIWVKFPIINGPYKGAFIVIWTTTPWTIPSNKAVAYNKDITYGIYRVQNTEPECWSTVGDLLCFADSLAKECLEKARITKFVRIASLDSGELEKMMLNHPFNSAPDSGDFWNYDVPMIDGDHVTEETGTGFVHTAPSHGADDFEAFVVRGWTKKMTHNISEDSSFKENVPFFSGLEVFDRKGKQGKANQAVTSKLIETGALLARGKLKHSYPHSWRSKAPVIFRNTPQWFVGIDKKLDDEMHNYGETIRQRALSSIDKLVKWTPVSGRNRLYSMIETRPDWVLSRQRAWGVPLTCFIKKGKTANDKDFLLKDEDVNSRIVEIFQKEGSDSWFEPKAKERFLDGLCNPDEYIQVMDILDVWFDSGSTHAFVLRDRPDGFWPADLYLEGTDQHRGWFHSSLLQACGTRGEAPYKGVLTHGFALDEKGMKMSKSMGNTVSPENVIRQYGADILRLWVAQSDYTTDLRIGPEILKGVSDSYRRIRNTMRFLLGSLADFDKNSEELDFGDMPELEKWVLNRVAELDSIVRKGYNDYSFQFVFQQVFQFCTLDLSSFYFDIRKDALYCDSKDSNTRRAARTVLDIIFHRLTTWLAPILVFTTEEVWFERFNNKEKSIHLTDFPKTPQKWLNPDLGTKWDLIRGVRRVVTGAIEVHRQDKVIGSSLEASIVVYFRDKKLYDVINSIDFSEVCITSSLETKLSITKKKTFTLVDVEGVQVEFNISKGQKCERCWKYVDETQLNFKFADTCKRCGDVLEKLI
jgi:isoleucyl-tRNA synthetase